MLQENLKYLRKKISVSQQILANAMSVSRTTLGDYERGRTEPDIETLIAIADYFDVPIDALLRKNLKREDYEIIRNKELRILAITVDTDDNENIELVNAKAEAGYIESFNDPEYLKELPKLNFPNLPGGTYRGFEIRGDSMLPMEPGSIVICSYIENLGEIKNDKTYVVISKSGGLVYKRVQLLENDNALLLVSDNDIYSPYTLPLEEVAEIWEYYANVNLVDPKLQLEQMIDNRITDMYSKVRDMYKLSARLTCPEKII
jgi:transcriptional regulator with XRE-family HTH domain